MSGKVVTDAKEHYVISGGQRYDVPQDGCGDCGASTSDPLCAGCEAQAYVMTIAYIGEPAPSLSRS